MATDSEKTAKEAPAPEELHTQSAASSAPTASGVVKKSLRPRHVTYRPSHKATFVSLAVVVIILAVNAGIIFFVLKGQAPGAAKTDTESVTLSAESLDKLGVSRNPVGNIGTELVVGPDSKFNGKVTVASDVSIGGQLKLNGAFTSSSASFAKLQAGDTSLSKLNVNGDATISNLNLRKDLSVAGMTRLQGPVTIAQLLTVNNNLNVAGNLAVGGTLSARSFQASSLVSDTTLTIGGHVITRGVAPGVGPGSALGANGTVSISGNDAAGTVAVNMGTGGGNGIVAYVAFHNQYGSTPHVVVSPVGRGLGSFYVNRSVGGFSIGVNNSVPPGGYAFDFIVMQ